MRRRSTLADFADRCVGDLGKERPDHLANLGMIGSGRGQGAACCAPILAGLDKFFHLLVNWDQYVPSLIARLSPIGAHNLMLGVGVVEIVAGLGVAWKPRIFAYVVAGGWR